MGAIESWIDKTLREAEFFNITNTVKRKSKASEDIRDTRDGKVSCAVDYGIDRITLKETGIPNESIDSLYRQLYVCTIGFLNTIKEVTKK